MIFSLKPVMPYQSWIYEKGKLMPAFKKIKDYDAEELNQAVNDAVKYCDKCGFDFYQILNGIDAYMERRRRKEETYPKEVSLTQAIKDSLK